MREYSGLDHLRSMGGSVVYCPKCGNYLEVVDNGWFHGQLFYCPKEKKVFRVLLKDITKQAGEEYLKQCEDNIQMEQTKRKITEKNYQKVNEFLGESQ